MGINVNKPGRAPQTIRRDVRDNVRPDADGVVRLRAGETVTLVRRPLLRPAL